MSEMGQLLPKGDVRVTSVYSSISDITCGEAIVDKGQDATWHGRLVPPQAMVIATDCGDVPGCR